METHDEQSLPVAADVDAGNRRRNRPLRDLALTLFALIRRFLRYLYLVRFPLLMLVALNFLVYLSQQQLKYMLSNLFELESRWDVTWVTGLATFTTITIIVTMVMILRLASLIDPNPSAPPPRSAKPALRREFLAMLAIIILGGVGSFWTVREVATQTSKQLDAGTIYRWTVVGIGASVVVTYVIWGLAHVISRWFNQREFFKKLTEKMPAPYYYDLRWHVTATILFIVTLAIFLWVGQRYQLVASNQLPALGYLMLLFLLFVWVLPAFSLFLDYLRVPTLLVLVILSTLVWSCSESDHFYQITANEQLKARQQSDPFTPQRAFAAWSAHKPVDQYPTLVIVTANGGGIRAALWTAHVLRTLHNQIGEDFTKSIALISAVSGGSVGTMFFVDMLEDETPPQDPFKAMVDKTAMTSIPQIARGIVYSDVPRVFLGSLIPPWRDRGWTLEQAWSHRLEVTSEQGMVSRWRAGIEAGKLPIVIFNTTVVETGERLLLTPMEMPQADCSGSSRNHLYFADCYEGYDIPVATAARLSASFPYISPLSQPISGTQPVTPGYHLGDGGYMDNNGVLSALDWLTTVRDQLAAEPHKRKILVVHIRSASLGNRRPPANRSFGWAYSFAGPLFTLMNSWQSTQVDRDSTLSRLLENALSDFEVQQVFFTYCGAGSLSWQLSKQEIKDITEETAESTTGGFGKCTDKRNEVEMARVRRFFEAKQ